METRGFEPLTPCVHVKLSLVRPSRSKSGIPGVGRSGEGKNRLFCGEDEGIRTPDPLRAKQIRPNFRCRPPVARNVHKWRHAWICGPDAASREIC